MCVKGLWKRAGALLVLWFSLSLAIVAQADTLKDTMRVAPGDQKVLNFPEAVAKVATSDPTVAALTVTGAERQGQATAQHSGGGDHAGILSAFWYPGTDRYPCAGSQSLGAQSTGHELQQCFQ